MYAQLVTFGTAFLGSAVESVEALTIVLAGRPDAPRLACLARGTLAALAALVLLVATLGQLITSRVPESTLKLVIGTLACCSMVCGGSTRPCSGPSRRDRAARREQGVRRNRARAPEPQPGGPTGWASRSRLQGRLPRGDGGGLHRVCSGLQQPRPGGCRCRGRRRHGGRWRGWPRGASPAGPGSPRTPSNTPVGLLLTTLGTFWAAEAWGSRLASWTSVRSSVSSPFTSWRRGHRGPDGRGRRLAAVVRRARGALPQGHRRRGAGRSVRRRLDPDRRHPGHSRGRIRRHPPLQQPPFVGFVVPILLGLHLM